MSNFYAIYPPEGSGSGGGGVTSLDGLVGALDLVAGSGISISSVGSDITITNTGSGTPLAIGETIVGANSLSMLFASVSGTLFQDLAFTYTYTPGPIRLLTVGAGYPATIALGTSTTLIDDGSVDSTLTLGTTSGSGNLYMGGTFRAYSDGVNAIVTNPSTGGTLTLAGSLGSGVAHLVDASGYGLISDGSGNFEAETSQFTIGGGSDSGVLYLGADDNGRLIRNLGVSTELLNLPGSCSLTLNDDSTMNLTTVGSMGLNFDSSGNGTFNSGSLSVLDSSNSGVLKFGVEGSLQDDGLGNITLTNTAFAQQIAMTASGTLNIQDASTEGLNLNGSGSGSMKFNLAVGGSFECGSSTTSVLSNSSLRVVGGHISTSQQIQPTVMTTIAGAGVALTPKSTDVVGSVNLTISSVSIAPAGGVICTVNFFHPYNSPPFVVISSNSDAAVAGGLYVSTINPTSFSISNHVAIIGGTSPSTISFTFMVMEGF